MPTHDPRLFESHQDIIPVEAIKGCRITIVGCGAIGTITGRILARLGGHRFHLIDGETVELRHLNREVFTHEQIGSNKATALAYQLVGIHPKVRAVTTAKPFAPAHLDLGKEDIVLLTTSEPGIPQAALDTLNTWPREQRPAIFVARHTGLRGGYWMADLRQGAVETIPRDIPWLVHTGRDAPDAKERIATTAHTVSGILAQAIVDHIMGRAVRERFDVDLEAWLRAQPPMLG